MIAMPKTMMQRITIRKMMMWKMMMWKVCDGNGVTRPDNDANDGDGGVDNA